MRDEDNDLKLALDDIFGSDFIEIDVKHDNETTKESLNEDIIKNVPKEPVYSIHENIENNHETYQTHPDFASLTVQDNSNTKKSNKKNIAWIIFSIIMIVFLVVVITNYVLNVEKVVYCSSSAKDEGYEYSDEYKITYKRNSIVYVESTYKYNAFDNEYKNQIEYIKEKKLPVVINSNGMPGFTYVYETSDDYFKVSGYLDFSLIKFESISKINQDLMPISYFRLSKDITFKKLKGNLEAEGFTCVSSK